MQLPDVSRTYPAEIEELAIGKGEYLIGGARSPAFLDLDGARHRRPVIFGEAYDNITGYPKEVEPMFSGREKDIEEWAVMWKELGADGVCLRLSRDDSPELVARISQRTRLPIMISGDTDILVSTAESIKDTVLIINCLDSEQSLEMAGCCGEHIVVAVCDDDPQRMIEQMKERGAKKVLVDLGRAREGGGMKDLRDRIMSYREDGLLGMEGFGHNIVCDVSTTWYEDEEIFLPARVGTMAEATAALTAMMAGADVIIVKSPGSADMARVYGEELADL